MTCGVDFHPGCCRPSTCERLSVSPFDVLISAALTIELIKILAPSSESVKRLYKSEWFHHLTKKEIGVYTPNMSEGVASLDLAKCAEAASVCACFNLRKASRIVTQMYNSVLRPSGLQATQLNLLVAVALAGPITVSDLAHALVMDRTTLTRNLKPLQAKRLIEVVSGEDRRRHVVTLTERGRRRVAKALLLWEEAQAQLIQELGHKRWRALLADLRAIASLRRN